MDWFLHYRNTRLNGLTKLLQITGDKYFHATFVCLHLRTLNKVEVFIMMHCSIIGNSIIGKVSDI